MLTNFTIQKYLSLRNWNSVGSRLGYKLHNWGITEFLSAARDSSLLQSVHACCWTHSASYSVGNAHFFWGVKQPGCEANHFPPFSAEVRNVWSQTATCQMWHRVNFTFTCSSRNMQYRSHVCYLRSWIWFVHQPSRRLVFVIGNSTGMLFYRAIYRPILFI